jgi:aminoglycoside 6'-N-acetyltransferase
LTAALPELRGERVVLRPAGEDDAEAIAAVLSEPGVARWWGSYDAERVRRELGGFAIVVEDEVAGWLIFEEETDPDYLHVALDIGLAAAFQGQGYGPEALRLVIGHFAGAGYHRFTIDPDLENERAIRAYEKTGFKPVGVMRAYGRVPDGRWRDHLLMDLLVGEID